MMVTKMIEKENNNVFDTDSDYKEKTNYTRVNMVDKDVEQLVRLSNYYIITSIVFPTIFTSITIFLGISTILGINDNLGMNMSNTKTGAALLILPGLSILSTLLSSYLYATKLENNENLHDLPIKILSPALSIIISITPIILLFLLSFTTSL